MIGFNKHVSILKQLTIYNPVDLPPSQKNRYNILCVIFEYNATYCALIFKIGINQQSHLSAAGEKIAKENQYLLFDDIN